MIIGIPNVGKSALLNTLRSHNLGFGKACQEGDRPGVTIRVQNRVRIWDRPAIYVLDTPGIMDPWANDIDSAMKLAICDTILESATKPFFVADYLLYHLNKHSQFGYIDALKLDQPSNEIKTVLLQVCRQMDLKRKVYVGSDRSERW